jgi:hypothetical protein
MSPDSVTATRTTDPRYAALEERVMARDQKGASEVYYGLVREGRPITEMLREAVRIHAPYTHVPYHERMDDGYVNFVNNDHCLLSARAALNLSKMLPGAASGLPLAQTIWYIPTGLDIWNQKIAKAPGHYSRGFQMPDGPPPAPVVHWPDQTPLALDGPLKQRLGQWMTLVHRGNVIEAYRVFLGLMQNPAERRAALAELCFAGLIDVQDRSFQNRSYTTGHKSFRARATVELGEAIGWDDAHDVLYAGALDMAVGPRYHAAYEMACQVSWLFLAEDDAKPKSSLAPSPTGAVEERLLRNTGALTPAEAERLIQALLTEPEPAYIDEITALLLAGKDPRRIVDTIQIAAARVVLSAGHPANFSMPHHGYEYTNTVRWFFDTFEHPHRIKLLYVAGSFINQAAHWVRSTPDNGESETRAPQGAGALTAHELLRRLDEAQTGLKTDESRAWVRAYLDAGHDRAPLVETLALCAVKEGNDPHNQEIGLCFLEDYGHSTAHDREILLLACAHHTAGHQKFGEPLEACQRFAEALGGSLTH